jgi:hypothetical protein
LYLLISLSFFIQYLMKTSNIFPNILSCGISKDLEATNFFSVPHFPCQPAIIKSVEYDEEIALKLIKRFHQCKKEGISIKDERYL